jgi:hypothetical protein
MKGVAPSFQPLMKARILVMGSLTLVKVPRPMAWRWMMPNQTSTRLSQDPEVGVKCAWILGFAASQSWTSTRLWVA